MKKTVYIIGAGFSKDLNAPLQSTLISEIFKLDTSQFDNTFKREIFQTNRDIFQDFLENILFISPANFEKIILEDVYTPIDRCIIDNLSFRNISKRGLIEIRQKINALLIILFQEKLRNIPPDNYAQKFAKYLVNIKRDEIDVKKDQFSILSLNWDIILDNALNEEIGKEEGVVDYCCYVTPYNKYENIMPGLLARGKGMFNVKLLKLHGSMNWLQCQRCQRLFVTFGEKIAVEEYLSKPKCRLCEENFKNEKDDEEAMLISQLLMPTFLKDLNNVQLKLIWQNAGIELSEANQVVFMGYSFPAADFEFRQLLSRFVRHNAEIKVILRYPPCRTNSDNPENRYRSFFGKRNISISHKGVNDYIVKNC